MTPWSAFQTTLKNNFQMFQTGSLRCTTMAALTFPLCWGIWCISPWFVESTVTCAHNEANENNWSVGRRWLVLEIFKERFPRGYRVECCSYHSRNVNELMLHSFKLALEEREKCSNSSQSTNSHKRPSSQSLQLMLRPRTPGTKL